MAAVDLAMHGDGTQAVMFELVLLEYSGFNIRMINCGITGLILGMRPVNETSLQSNAVSHWLGAILESALDYILRSSKKDINSHTGY